MHPNYFRPKVYLEIASKTKPLSRHLLIRSKQHKDGYMKGADHQDAVSLLSARLQGDAVAPECKY